MRRLERWLRSNRDGHQVATLGRLQRAQSAGTHLPDLVCPVTTGSPQQLEPQNAASGTAVPSTPVRRPSVRFGAPLPSGLRRRQSSVPGSLRVSPCHGDLAAHPFFLVAPRVSAFWQRGSGKCVLFFCFPAWLRINEGFRGNSRCSEPAFSLLGCSAWGQFTQKRGSEKKGEGRGALFRSFVAVPVAPAICYAAMHNTGHSLR